MEEGSLCCVCCVGVLPSTAGTGGKQRIDWQHREAKDVAAHTTYTQQKRGQAAAMPPPRTRAGLAYDGSHGCMRPSCERWCSESRLSWRQRHGRSARDAKTEGPARRWRRRPARRAPLGAAAPPDASERAEADRVAAPPPPPCTKPLPLGTPSSPPSPSPASRCSSAADGSSNSSSSGSTCCQCGRSGSGASKHTRRARGGGVLGAARGGERRGRGCSASAAAAAAAAATAPPLLLAGTLLLSPLLLLLLL